MLKLLKRIAGPVILLCVSLLLAEGLLRIVPSPVQYPTVHEIGNPDSVLGIEMIPSTVSTERQSCVEAEVTINRHGWRDLERSKQKDSDKTRIAVIGDSFVAGFQVGDSETLTQQLEKGLGTENVEVLNFGLSALGTVQEEILYDEIVREYDPDIVLVGFYTNDVQTNGGLSAGESQYLSTRDAEGNIVTHPDTSRFAGLRRFLRVHSATFRLIKMVDRRARELFSGSQSPEETPAVPYHLSIYTDPNSTEWLQSWSKTEDAFNLLRQKVEADGKKLIVFAFPDILQVADNPAALVKEQFNIDLPQTTNFRAPHDQLYSFFRREKFESIDLLPQLLDYKDENELSYPYFYFTCDGHMNALGLEISAKIIGEYLRPLIQ